MAILLSPPDAIYQEIPSFKTFIEVMCADCLSMCQLDMAISSRIGTPF